MSGNPFDDESANFYVLVNSEEQHSLWPTFKQVPGGWTVVFGDDGGAGRQECLDYVERSWTDMRPKSLQLRMAAAAGSSGADVTS
jgi:MbtH protein